MSCGDDVAVISESDQAFIRRLRSEVTFKEFFQRTRQNSGVIVTGMSKNDLLRLFTIAAAFGNDNLDVMPPEIVENQRFLDKLAQKWGFKPGEEG